MAKSRVFEVEGRKYYPCCSLQKHQHKLFYWSNYYENRYDETHDDKDYDQWQLWSDIYGMSISCSQSDGIMYFPYPEYNTVKEGIMLYDLQH